MSNDNTDKLYTPFNGFDGPEHRLKLKPTSKVYVREVCDVQAKRMVLTDKDRCDYADQAGYKRTYEDKAGKKVPVFELKDVYDEYHIHAAMAQAMFFECPPLIEIAETKNGWNIDIVNPELFDALDEGQVNDAFLSFMSARSGIRSGRPPSFRGSQSTPVGN